MNRTLRGCLVILMTALGAVVAPLYAQEIDGQCVLAAISQAEAGTFRHAECPILEHLFVVDYNDPILHATVSGPVVNTSRSFNIPRRVASFGYRVQSAVPAQSQKDEAILWVISVIEQIRSGLSRGTGTWRSSAA